MSLILCLVSCRVGNATPKQNDQRVVFYVFGSEGIYIVDPKTKAILSTIGPDGVCTKSNNRYSRWACLNNNICRKFSHSLPWCKYISSMRESVSSPDETRLKDWEESWKYDAQVQRSIFDELRGVSSGDETLCRNAWFYFSNTENDFTRRDQGCKNEQFFIWFPNTH